MVSVEQELLHLAAAARARGMAGMREALAEIFEVLAPFDRGEIAFLREGQVVHWGLRDNHAAVAGDDLVRHMATHPVSVRIDHLLEAEPFPATRIRLEETGQRSLLALPLAGHEGPEGAMILAREFGWAFAGASLRRLEPIARMAGLLLDMRDGRRKKRGPA